MTKKEITNEQIIGAIQTLSNKVDRFHKETKTIVCDVLEELVLPRLQNIEDDVSVLKNGVSELKEDVHDLQLTTNRIETLQKSELGRADEHTLILNNHEKRFLKLEKSKA